MSAAEEARAVAYRAEIAAQQRAIGAREVQLRGSPVAYRSLYAATKPLLADEHRAPDVVYAWPDQVGADQAEGIDERG